MKIMKKLFIIALLSLTCMTNVKAQTGILPFLGQIKAAIDTTKKVNKQRMQEQNKTTKNEIVYDVVDVMPSFPGGQGALFEFLD